LRLGGATAVAIISEQTREAAAECAAVVEVASPLAAALAASAAASGVRWSLPRRGVTQGIDFPLPFPQAQEPAAILRPLTSCGDGASSSTRRQHVWTSYLLACRLTAAAAAAAAAGRVRPRWCLCHRRGSGRRLGRAAGGRHWHQAAVEDGGARRPPSQLGRWGCSAAAAVDRQRRCIHRRNRRWEPTRPSAGLRPRRSRIAAYWAGRRCSKRHRCRLWWKWLPTVMATDAGSESTTTTR